MLDAALQGLAAAMPGDAYSDSGEVTYLPVGMESIRVFGEVGRRARCRAEIVSIDQDSGDAVGRVTLMDETGTVTAEIDRVRLRRIQRRTVPLPLSQKIFDTVWTEEPVDGASDESPGSWLLLTDGAAAEATAEDLATRFGSPARRVLTADLNDESAVKEAFTIAAADPDLPPAGVLLLVGHPAFDPDHADGAQVHARGVIWEVAALVRAIATGWHGKPPRLWLVSRGGLAVTGTENPGAGNPGVGSLRGLVRVLAYEHPDLRATLVDLDTGSDAVAALTAELAASGSDDVIAWRG
jgi:phthiocerol/phenolphthiocerol synthesis type-I polyketide synthase D